MLHRSGLIALALLFSPFSAVAEPAAELPDDYCRWKVTDFAIEESLCGLSGDAERGKQIVTDAYRGNCLACHQLPVDGIEAYGLPARYWRDDQPSSTHPAMPGVDACRAFCCRLGRNQTAGAVSDVPLQWSQYRDASGTLLAYLS